MGTTKERKRRSHLGYGSSYRKGAKGSRSEHGIPAVLGGQTWIVTPDRKARSKHPCLWQQAGVTAFKSCNNYYDCTRCKYDGAMQTQVSKGKLISWQDAMRKRPDLERVCRHSLTQRIARRACGYDYQCSKCDFDQFFEDVWTAQTKSTPSQMQQIKGFAVPMDYHFHQGHTWARVESGGTIRIGLDDFALKVLGRADALDLPLMGKELDQGRPGWGLKRKHNTADVLSPIDGVIMEVNPRVRQRPALANGEPYGEGWLFTVHTPDIKKTVGRLMCETLTLDWMDNEVGTLENMVEEVAGPLAADGGYLSEDVYGNLPALGWSRLANAFLKT